MADRKYYVLCEQNCKFEGMTKEQILTAIAQAVENGTVGDIDIGFVTTIKTINGKPLKFFVGTQAEYESLSEEQKEDLFALITNDTTATDIMEAIDSLDREISQYKEAISEEFAKSVEECKAELLEEINTREDVLWEHIDLKADITSFDSRSDGTVLASIGSIILAKSTNTPGIGDTVNTLYLPQTIIGNYKYAFKDEEKANAIQTVENPSGTVQKIIGTWICCGAFPAEDNGYLGMYQRIE